MNVRLDGRSRARALWLGAVLVSSSLTFATVQPVISVGGGRSLAVPLYKQKMTQWCWAGATESIVSYLFGLSYAQCTQANHYLRRGDCCPTNSVCNRAAGLLNVSDYLAANKSIVTDYAGRLSWSSVTAEIGTRGKPFWIRWGWGGSLTNGHIVVARGYTWNETTGGYYSSQISTMDPADQTYKWYDWSWFNSNSTFTWTNSLWKARRL